MQTHASLIRTIHQAKATLHEVEDRFNRVSPERPEAWLQRMDETVEAMNVAETLVAQIAQELDRLTGSPKWAQAMEIAYAPNDLDGYPRVAEYYRRLDLIQAL
jgi:truncated hemoglobin YjbI